jgi:hypothetical protein
LAEGATEGLDFGGAASDSRVEGLAIGGFDIGLVLAGTSSPSYACANYLGVGLDGTTEFPNDVGFETGFGAAGVRVGTECPNGGNLISGNLSYGIADFGNGSVIGDNRIGVDAKGAPRPNGRPLSMGAGILVANNASEPFIGGIGGVEGFPDNVIAYNEGAGILVESGSSKTTIQGNSIHDNLNRGIQIESSPPPVPVIESSAILVEETRIGGSIVGEPNSPYDIDFYVNEECDPSGFGEGQEYLGSEFVETDGSGHGSFVASGLDEPFIEGETFTATATNTLTGATSSFSACADEPPDTTIEAPTPPNSSSSAEAEFTFSGTDPDGGVDVFECKLDGGFFEECSSPQSFSDLEDGSHTFQVRALDHRGKPDPTPASYTWIVDTTFPAVELTETPPDPSSSGVASFDFSAEDAGGSGLAKVECRLDAAALAPCSGPLLLGPLADGSHSFEVRATDNAGNAAAETFTWTVDTTAPTTTIESGPPVVSPSGDAFFEFAGDDGGGSGVTGFECKLDAGTFEPCFPTQVYSELPDGSHTLEVRTKDNAGNVDATPATYTWTVDTTAPTTTIESEPPDPSSGAVASFTFSGEDPGGSGVAGFECKLDGEVFESCVSPQNLSGLEDGSHTFQVRAVDAVGNSDATPATYTWTVDTVTPTTAIESGPPKPSESSAASFVFSGSDEEGSGVADVECRIDAEAFAPCVSPKGYSGLADGPHTFEARSVDKAGNVDATPASYTWTIDTTAPTTTIESEPPDPTASHAPEFTFSGADPGGTGVAGSECKLDAEAFAPCTSPQEYTGLADGPHTFQVRAIDNAGNTEATPASYTWTIDSAAPEPPELTATDPESPSTETEPLVIGSAEGATVSLYASPDCEPSSLVATVSPAELEAGVPVTVAADSVSEFSATASSATAVASACSEPIEYRADSTPPVTTIGEATPPAESKTNAAIFTFGGEDTGGSGVTGFECSLDSAAFAPCTSPQEYTGLADGPHAFQVRARDAAGNDSSPSTYGWAVDTSTPSQPQALINPAPPATNGESVAVAPESGKVFVRRPGQKRPTELKEGQTIPVGSIVDATHGKVLLTSVNANGETQSAVFYGGKFLVTQHDGSGLVILKMRGGDLSSCPGGTAKSPRAGTSGKKGRHLWGSGHGNFRTEGNNGSATVRGTVWFVEDRCDGTFFKTKRGIVTIRDFKTKKSFALPAGKSYLAQP